MDGQFLTLKQIIISQLILSSFAKHETQPILKFLNVTKISCQNLISIIAKNIQIQILIENPNGTQGLTRGKQRSGIFYFSNSELNYLEEKESEILGFEGHF
jgi:hypothetical protein